MLLGAEALGEEVALRQMDGSGLARIAPWQKRVGIGLRGQGSNSANGAHAPNTRQMEVGKSALRLDNGLEQSTDQAGGFRRVAPDGYLAVIEGFQIGVEVRAEERLRITSVYASSDLLQRLGPSDALWTQLLSATDLQQAFDVLEASLVHLLCIL